MEHLIATYGYLAVAEAFLFLVAVGAGLWIWRFLRGRRATDDGEAAA